jgi:hypothetical protein
LTPICASSAVSASSTLDEEPERELELVAIAIRFVAALCEELARLTLEA